MSRWLGSRAGAWVTAILAVAAAGAVWAMAAIMTREVLPWMALALAWVAALAGRSLGLRSRWMSGLAAGVLAGGGTAYALALAATDRLARMLGRGFLETAMVAGPEMIAALASTRLDGFGLAVVALGPLVAALWASRRGAGRREAPPG